MNVEPLFFGDQLFGVHHPPRDTARDFAVVLCQATFDEYVNAHRAFRVLADRLARAGFHVFRFDYFGTGDSAGDIKDADVGRWVDDVQVAVTEARNHSGKQKAALIGLRLGGALATLAAAKRNDVPALVLWEPVAKGARYVEELRQRQRRWIHEQALVHSAAPRLARNDEVMGFALSPRLTDSLDQIDLHRLHDAPAERVLLLREAAANDGFFARWSDDGAAVDTRMVDDGQVYLSVDAVRQALVPARLIGDVAKWLGDGA